MPTENDTVPTPVFPLGKALKSRKFTGTVWLQWLVEPDDTFNCPAVNVTFEAGCRNNWHRHPGGQILLCTDGAGRYQERGKPVIALKPGDVVKIAPDVEHWHGAAPDTAFTHIAIETNPKAGPAVWLEPVSEEDYRAEPEKSEKKTKNPSRNARKSPLDNFQSLFISSSMSDPRYNPCPTLDGINTIRKTRQPGTPAALFPVPR